MADPLLTRPSLLARSAEARAILRAHQGSVLGVAFSPDGRTLATVGEDRLGKLWDLDRLAKVGP